MPENEKTLIEFLAKWFHFFRGHKPEVTIANTQELKDPRADEKFSTLLDKVTGVDEGVRDAIKSIKFPEMPEAIKVSNFPEPTDTQKVEITNWQFPKFPEIPEVKIPEFPKFPEIPKPLTEISVKNFPKPVADQKIHGEVVITNPVERQQIYGDVGVIDLNKVVGGLQVIVDVLQELRRDMEGLRLEREPMITAVPMGSYKEPVKGIIKYDPDDSAPDYIGTHDNAYANDGDTDWEILKFTYSGSNVTQTQKAKGSWTNRASLF